MLMNMATYDTILFGNGLTTALFSQMHQLRYIKNSERSLCNINERVCSLIGAPVDSPNYRKVLPLFGIFGRNVPNYEKMVSTQKEEKQILKRYIPEIRKYGMEYFVGKHLYDNDVNEHFTFLYLLYNFWYKEIEESVLVKPSVVEFLKEVTNELSIQFKEILTLNFDLLLDNSQINHPIRFQHIHGRFVESLHNYGNLQYFTFDEEQHFEYPYLFGSNAIEKTTRILRINSKKYDYPTYNYDLDFLFSEDKNWGNILIYGVSFLPTAIFTDEFFVAYPKYQETPGDMKYYFSNSLDGHILYRIQKLIEKGKIEHVHIAYYSEKDKVLYENLLNKTPIATHLSLHQCNDISFSSNLKKLLGLRTT